MAHAYVDDNETIYWEDGDLATIPGGQKYSMFFSPNSAPLDNLIPGQSTVFVNSLTFKASGYIDPDGSDLNRTVFKMLCGIVPFDTFMSTNGPEDLEDYQELKGWPLKGCFQYSNLLRPRDVDQTEGAWMGYNSNFSLTKTYKPRKALLLSRLQSVCFTMKNDITNGSDCQLHMSIAAQLKRGD